jgi:purine-binding chemotaxis protein CheW
VRLGEDLHAIPIEWVEEVLPALPIETVPQCPEFVRGVVFVRGHLIPVLDAAERLGLESHQRAAEPHIVCLRINDRLVGVEFDEALDLMDLGSGESLAADRIGAREEFFAGLVERDGQIVRVLDPEKLMATEETDELKQVPHTG